MAGESVGKVPYSVAGDEWMSLIRGLKMEEILEVLSDGFCEHCQSVLQTRIHNLLHAALCYLHNDYKPPIVYCDLKPSNVLMDEELTGHIGDFGLARLLRER